MKKSKKIKSLLGGLLVGVAMLLPGETAAARKPITDYSYYEVRHSPDGEAWTVYQEADTSRYVAYSRDGTYHLSLDNGLPYFWYGPEDDFSTGIASTLRAAEVGEHYYEYAREGMMPVGQWRVAWRQPRCIQEVDFWNLDMNWHGIEYMSSKNCFCPYFSGWFAYCADCGEPVQTNIYMSKEAAHDLKQIPLGKDYYYLCPSCHHLEQGVRLEHDCKAISFNRYAVQYEKNGSNVNGDMQKSFHMYNNSEVFEGNPVTPLKYLSLNRYTRNGYRFIGWNTKPDGSGVFFADGGEIFNLTTENYNQYTGTGVVTLYAQWERVQSSLAFDANGGIYIGENPVRRGYESTCDLSTAAVIPPAGSMVSFETNGGGALPSIRGTKTFVRWEIKAPLKGRLIGNLYLFMGAQDDVDTAVAVYAAEPVTLPGPEKPNASFGGWYADEELTVLVGYEGDLFTPAEDVTLYARWVDLRLYSSDNYTDNGGRGAVDLRWIQPDREEKTYKLYQSGDGGAGYVQISDVSASAEALLSRTFVFEKEGDAPREQTLVIPSSGIYELKAEAAQGGGYGDYRGGLGGSVSGRFYLTKGEVLTFLTGGQDGTGGGGQGSAYGNGGGMTLVSSDQKGVLLVAGGGGGAGASGDGQPGGTGTNPVEEHAGEDGMSGGGGGYPGGAAGEYIVHTCEPGCFIHEGTQLYAGHYDTHPDEENYNYGDPVVWQGGDSEDEENDEVYTFVQFQKTVSNFEKYDAVYAEYASTAAFAEVVRHDKSYVRLTDQDGRVLAEVSPGALVNEKIFGNGGSVRSLVMDILAGCVNFEGRWEAYGELVSSYTFHWLDRNLQFSYTPTEGSYDENDEPHFEERDYCVVFTPVTDGVKGWINVLVLRNAPVGEYEYYEGWGEDLQKGVFDPLKVNPDYIIHTNDMGSRRYLPEGIYSEVVSNYGRARPGYESWVSENFEIVCRAAYYNNDLSVTEVTAQSLFAFMGGFCTTDMKVKGDYKRRVCGYQDGQVISAKPAYGGSNYISEGYAITWDSLCGAVEGNGGASLEALSVGMLEALELKGVKAPDRAAPDPVPEGGIQKTAVGSSEVLVSFDGVEDRGTKYYFYAESYSTRTGELMCTSNTAENTLKTGVKEYFYLVDTSPGTTLTGTERSLAAQDGLSLLVEIRPFIQYLHLAAADGAGNLSGTTHVEIRMDDRQLFWQPYTEQMDIGSVVGDRDYGNVYPAEEERAYYVKADGSTPFLLSFRSYIEGVARADYQIDYQAIKAVLADGAEQTHTARLPLTVPLSSQEPLDGRVFERRIEGASVIRDAMYIGAQRSGQAGRVSFYQAFTLDGGLNGQVIDITPAAGAGTENGEVLYSDSGLDAAHGLKLVADGEAPAITGMEAFRSIEVIDRTQGGLVLEVRAEDALSGLRDFWLKVENIDNYSSRVYAADEDGVVRIEVTGSEALYSGDFTVTAYAVDNVGNEASESWHVTEFSLETGVERILSPHEPVFKRGESGVLLIDAWGYVDRVEVEFPDFLSAYDQSFDYTAAPDYKQLEEIQFMIPLYAPEGTEYQITVRAYKGDKKLEEHPSIRTLGVQGSVLDEIRTRLR